MAFLSMAVFFLPTDSGMHEVIVYVLPVLAKRAKNVVSEENSQGFIMVFSVSCLCRNRDNHHFQCFFLEEKIS